jgi:nucleotide-binding universal stress UspA family protein
MRPIRKILHPTDFSPAAEAATELAIDLARRLDADLTLLNVYAVPVYTGPLGDAYVVPTELVQKLSADAEANLQEVCDRAIRAGVRATTAAVEGIPSEAIVALADSRGMDLIVMGTHGLTGFKHLLLGSVAERVLRGASCPVLTVRQPQSA